MVASGNYNETLVIQGFIGSGYIKINGDGVISNSRSIINLYVLYCTCYIIVNGFYLSNSDVNISDITISSSVRVDLYWMNITNYINNIGVNADNSNVYLHQSTISNKNNAFYSGLCNNSLLQNVGGTNNNKALVAAYGGIIAKDAITITGTTQEYAYTGGVIR